MRKIQQMISRHVTQLQYIIQYWIKILGSTQFMEIDYPCPRLGGVVKTVLNLSADNELIGEHVKEDIPPTHFQFCGLQHQFKVRVFILVRSSYKRSSNYTQPIITI